MSRSDAGGFIVSFERQRILSGCLLFLSAFAAFPTAAAASQTNCSLPVINEPKLMDEAAVLPALGAVAGTGQTTKQMSVVRKVASRAPELGIPVISNGQAAPLRKPLPPDATTSSKQATSDQTGEVQIVNSPREMSMQAMVNASAHASAPVAIINAPVSNDPGCINGF